MPLSESQKGKIAETLIAAHLVLGSDGLLNVSTPMVDGEGVDLVINLRDRPRHMLLQVKSRFGLTGKGNYSTNVRRASFKPGNDLYMLFAFIDKDKTELGEVVWLIPSLKFADNTCNQNKERKVIRFQSRFTSQKDMWVDFMVTKEELPDRIVQILYQG
jgi:hypothetical protein